MNCSIVIRAYNEEKHIGRLLNGIRQQTLQDVVLLDSGQSGEWKKYFKEEHKKIFKDVAGNLFVKLGYEKNNDW